MNWKVLHFTPATNHEHFTASLQFNPSLFGYLIGRRAYVSKFVDNQDHWFEYNYSGKQFLCDPETSKFLSVLRAELEVQFKALPKDQRKSFPKRSHLRIVR